MAVVEGGYADVVSGSEREYFGGVGGDISRGAFYAPYDPPQTIKGQVNDLVAMGGSGLPGDLSEDTLGTSIREYSFGNQPGKSADYVEPSLHTNVDYSEVQGGGRAHGKGILEGEGLTNYLGKDSPIMQAIDKVGRAVPAVMMSSMLGPIAGTFAKRGMGKIMAEAGKQDEPDIRTASLSADDYVDSFTGGGRGRPIAAKTGASVPEISTTPTQEANIEQIRDFTLPEAPAAPTQGKQEQQSPVIPSEINKRIALSRFAPLRRTTPPTGSTRQSFAVRGRRG